MAFGDDDFVDPALLQELLELAVGNDFDQTALLPPRLQQQNGKDGDDAVDDVDACFAFYGASAGLLMP
jgi:hypothetical protein